MPETSEGNDNPAPPAGQSSATDAPADQLGEGGIKALEAERERAKQAEARAKAAEKALESARRASMSESEKAIDAARAAARTETLKEVGGRLVRTEIAAAAARRNADFDSSALDYLDLSRFVGDDGEPDVKAITAAVERLVPARVGAPSFDGGSRQSPPATGDMNSIIRKAAGLG